MTIVYSYYRRNRYRQFLRSYFDFSEKKMLTISNDILRINIWIHESKLNNVRIIEGSYNEGSDYRNSTVYPLFGLCAKGPQAGILT
jgi:hypothetical protein